MKTSEAIRNVQPFEAEKDISPWGWIAVGGVIAGTMAVGAWLATQVDRYGAISAATRKARS